MSDPRTLKRQCSHWAKNVLKSHQVSTSCRGGVHTGPLAVPHLSTRGSSATHPGQGLGFVCRMQRKGEEVMSLALAHSIYLTSQQLELTLGLRLLKELEPGIRQCCRLEGIPCNYNL